MIASGQAATAFGWGTRAEGENSTSFGQITVAYGGASTAFGWGAQAIGDISTAFGDASEAYGYGATAFGDSSKAFGDYSTAFGEETIAAGEFSTSFGHNTQSGRLLYDTTEALIIKDNEEFKIVDANNTSTVLQDGFTNYDEAYGVLTREGAQATALLMELLRYQAPQYNPLSATDTSLSLHDRDVRWLVGYEVATLSIH